MNSANLDLLRCTAVGLVYAFHLLLTIGYKPPDSMGRFGVLLFFVHTSLVLMMSLERTERKGFKLFGNFYTRRFFRLFPLSIFCVLVIWLLHLPRAPWWPQLAYIDPATLLANVTLTMNLLYKEPLSSVLWTLPYEVQMYVLLPFFYIAGRLWGSRAITKLWGLSVLLAIVLPVISTRLSIAHYGPCFLSGVFAFFAGTERKQRVPAVIWPLLIAALTIAYCWCPQEDLGSWVACLVLGVAIPRFREISISILNRFTKAVAKYSYGIYLTHLQVFWFCRSVLHVHYVMLQWALLVALSVAVPIVLYHLLEEPMIKWGMKLGRRVRLAPAPITQPA